MKRLNTFIRMPLSWRRITLSLFLLACLAGMEGCMPAKPASHLTDTEKLSRIERMTADYRSDFPRARGVTIEKFLAWRAQRGDVVLVDVRDANERAVSTIPGAITREEFGTRKAEFSRRPVVAYCTIGYRSGEYAQALLDEGVDAYNLEGSILAWVHAGQPVNDAQGNATRRVHTYGAQWALLPEGYEAVYD
jgi:sodium/bile acid cotransporter 7